MRKPIFIAIGVGVLNVACSSSDETGGGTDAGGDAGPSGGASAGGAHGSGGKGTAGSGGTGGATSGSGGATSGSGGTVSGSGGTTSGSGGALSGTGGSTQGGTGGRGATDASTNSGGADASGMDGSSGSVDALCRAAVAARCSRGPQSLSECLAKFQTIASCPVVQACVACAGASPTVTCQSGGGPEIVGCDSQCNIDACKDGGQSDSGSTRTSCSGSDLVIESPGGSSPMLIPFTGKPIALFGPLESGGQYGELGGQFEVTGLAPGDLVHVDLIEFPCAHTGCPTSLSFAFAESDGGRVILGSTDAGCGGGGVHADQSGHLTFGVGKVGSGPEEHNLGVLLTAVKSPDGGGPYAGGARTLRCPRNPHFFGSRLPCDESLG